MENLISQATGSGMSGNVIGLGIGIAALGVGIGQGIAANGALQGMSRQPEAIGKIQSAMIIALVFMELVFILTFVTTFTAK